jgi:hypothetical protein
MISLLKAGFFLEEQTVMYATTRAALQRLAQLNKVAADE